MILLYAECPEGPPTTEAFRILGYVDTVETAEALCGAYATIVGDHAWQLAWVEAGPPITLADIPQITDDLRAWHAGPRHEGDHNGVERPV